MKKTYCLLFALTLCACTPSWVHELEGKNPLKDSARFTSVYFRFDTIINDFEVSGILYPQYDEVHGWDGYDNGARMFFRSLKTGKEYVWTDWDEGARCFKSIFMSKNVYDIVVSEGFNGFKTGDTYIFNYDTTPLPEPSNDLYPNAEYQFYDVDFDGAPELLINYYHGGPYGCTCYEIFEMTDSVLVRKEPVNEPDKTWFSLDDNTKFDAANKTITNTFHSGFCEWEEDMYRVDDKGDIYAVSYVYNFADTDNDIIKSDTTYRNL